MNRSSNGRNRKKGGYPCARLARVHQRQTQEGRRPPLWRRARHGHDAAAFFDAVKRIKGKRKGKVILMSPSGKRLTQKLVRDLAKDKNLIVLCGHYEGVDERVREKLVDESISIGDYVLTGGEIPAMVLIDCVTRLLPGVVGKEASLTDESFEGGLLEYPHYTRPANFRGVKVPDVLLSGNHLAIKKWRQEQSCCVTRRNRPDLIKNSNSI